jgi:hypothetical protein
MRKIFLTLAVFVMAICANAQKNQYFWYQGNLMLGTQIAQIDSVTFGEGEPTDTLHIMLPRTIIKTVHDTVYITIHDTVCPNNIPEGALNGVFSVAADKKVRFSKGNLQFHMKDSIWRFADKQYEFLGDANSNCGNPSYDGYIDLFGWSTASTYFGVNTSSSNSTYKGDFVDWGVNINNGWFTLSHDEWTYLYQGRPNADKLYGMACVNGVNGCIFLPDDWQTPQGITFNTGTHYLNDPSSYALVNNLTIEEWGKLEQNGAVFLSAAADRDGVVFNSMWSTWYYGFYWTSTSNGTTSADCFVINPAELSTGGSNNRHYGDAVRLVIEVE